MLASATARNMSLDSKWGSSRSSVWPSSIQFRLYTGDPTASGVEVTGGGYAPVSVTNDNTFWAAASNSQKVNIATITFPTSTGAWTGNGAWIAITKTDGTLLEAGPLTDMISVSTTGRVISFIPGDVALIEQTEVL